MQGKDEPLATKSAWATTAEEGHNKYFAKEGNNKPLTEDGNWAWNNNEPLATRAIDRLRHARQQ